MQVWADEVWQRLCDPLQGSDGAQQVDLVGQKLLPVLERVQYGWHQPVETNTRQLTGGRLPHLVV